MQNLPLIHNKDEITMSDEDRKNTMYKPLSIEFNDLEFVTGGVGDVITLYRYECKCGWISDISAKFPDKIICELCDNKNNKDFIHYAFINGMWVKDN